MSSLLPYLFFAIGLGAVAHGLALIRRARASETWPSVTGTVTRSEVVLSGNSHGTTTSHTHKSSIEYRYEVAGRRYKSDRIAAGGVVDWSMRGPAETRCARYPLGAQIEVHYDQRNPKMACLEHGADGGRFTAGIGGIFAVVGLLGGVGVIPFH